MKENEDVKKVIEVYDTLHEEERKLLWDLLRKKGKISEEDWKRLTANPNESWTMKEE